MNARHSGLRSGTALGGPIEETRPGDVVWIATGEKNWHGAAPTIAMTHIAVVEKAEEDSTGWMEHVTDEQYLSEWEETYHGIMDE